jgi:ABC-type antimicrobial peptide transport system permease subunit
MGDEHWASTPQPTYQELGKFLPEAEAIGGTTRVQDVRLIFDQQAGEKEIETLAVFGDFFEIFTQKFITGNKPAENAREVIISDHLARQLYNSTDVVGKDISLALGYPYFFEQQSFKITGVVEAPPPNTNLPFEIIFWCYPNENDRWNNFYSSTYIKLGKNTELGTIQPKLKDIEVGAQIRSYDTVPVNRVKYMSKGENFWEAYSFLIITAFVGALLLISALFNYIVLAITGIMSRLKESALRKTVGAQAKDIFGLYYSEIVLSFVIVLFISSVLFVLLKKPIFDITEIVMDGISFYSVVVVLWFICLITSFVFSIYPIRKINRLSIHQSIIKSKNHFRKVVLTLQVIICVFLLISLVEMGRQFYFVNNTDFGFERKNILELKIPLSSEGLLEPLTDNLKLSQDIEDVIMLHHTFFRKGYFTRVNGIFDDSEKDIQLSPVQAGFTEFFGLKIIKGSNFDPKDTGISQAIVNEKVLKEFPTDDIIGKVINIRNVDIEIVGVVNDFHTNPMNTEIYPHIFATGMDDMWGSKYVRYYIKYFPGKEKEARQTIMESCENVLPGIHVELITFDEYVSSFYKSEVLTLRIFGVIAFACLIICLLGVYAMVNLTTRQRQREIAIRKVNGAENKDIFIKLLKEYILIVIVASIIALPPAYIFMDKWLETYVYKITLGVEGIWVIVLIMCLVVFTVIQKIIKVSRTNPAESLKSE